MTLSHRCSTWITLASKGSGYRTAMVAAKNLDAIHLFREFNEQAHAQFPGILTIAEESTAWPGVSRPTSHGGLGFSLKWNMGWMNDTLRYMRHDPIHRQYHHDELTFSLIYAFTENFSLPLSHDEVVHGKGALIAQNGRRSLAKIREPAFALFLHVDTPR